MTDNEIIKALDYCCGNQKFDEECSENVCYQAVLPEMRNGDLRWCRQWLIKDAVDLIKRQQAEIKRLNNNMDAMVKEHNNLMKTIREDVIREFEEKVKEKMTEYNKSSESYSFNVLTIEDITLIANEMTGGEK